MSHSSLEIMDLEVFSAIARLGSFSAAAAELRLAAPSVSNRIAALERRLGTALFVRGARGSTLTPAGQRLVGYARRCLDLLDEAVHSLDTGIPERLVLAAPNSFAATVFPLAFKALDGLAIAAHGRVAHSREVVEQVRDGSAHGGFLLTQVATGPLRSERLGASPMVAVCQPGHRLCGEPELTPDDLVTSTLVVYRWDAEGEPLAAIFDHPERRRDTPVHTTGSPEAAIRHAVDSGHIAVVPRFAARSFLRLGHAHLLPVRLPRWSVELRFVYLAANADNPGVAALLDSLPWLRDQLRG
ncbi:LysR family transcriptional regulator [Streptomyces sp. SID8382]|uniref:LysR family transcriptional regulator n=1 Tax=Streptomyces TaxID=1883 RepID=UPI00081E5A79|nr:MULTISPECIES: LysR family transcriptional regulator [unclassified Streptomyces]AUA17061.1 HTH-type transcriptional activator CmpR [Streptomyces sp. M56]MYX55493.1 LysR family transcriptional regulator [Streptomyces sp. SID8382]SCF91532.1 DNA-binding transcriptional regulator, LysR family [Streptomyces sp. MnatMP-M27]